MTRDARILFVTRGARMFGYGFLSVVLALYLAAAGMDGLHIGLVLTLTLAGDAVISLWLTTHADRLGRRPVLLAGAVLMVLAGIVFALSSDFWVLVAAATLGVISPSGNEVGPFLAVEQAALAQTLPERQRTRVFGWYNLAGSLATAAGALAGGVIAQALQLAGVDALDSYRVVLVAYAVVGVAMAGAFWFLSPAIEAPVRQDVSIARRLGLHRSRGIVARLSMLFALDAFSGALVMQSLIAYWLHVRFGIGPGALGGIFFVANVLAGISALAAARLAARFGLLNTMVLTHLPSNVLLMLVPLMPTLPLAAGVLLVRYSISQMDVPTRQSYTMAVVDPDERSAAAGVTGVARSIGSAVSPSISSPLLAIPALGWLPFVAAGGLKIVYDVLLYRGFRGLRPPEESGDGPAQVRSP